MFHTSLRRDPPCPIFFFFNDTATTEIYTLSLHDALPISFSEAMDPLTITTASLRVTGPGGTAVTGTVGYDVPSKIATDRKSTRLNSSHSQISYAVFCLKKKNTQLPT